MASSTPLTRVQLVALIASNGSVVFDGQVYTDPNDLPTQSEIDAIYGNVSGSFSDTGIIAATNSVKDRLPAALDADGGIKVHVQNQSEGTGGGAVTVANGADVALGNTADADTALTVIGRLKKILALITDRLPAALGGAGGIKVDIVGGNPTAIQVSNFPATQAVSAAALPLPAGASTSANQTTQNTSLASIDGKLPTALSGGALKVDIVGNSAGVGGSAAPAPVDVLPIQARSLASNTIQTADISGRGYKGILITCERTAAAGGSAALSVRYYKKSPSGAYFQMFTTPTMASGSDNQIVELLIYPGVFEQAAGATLLPTNRQPRSHQVDDVFRLELFHNITGSVTSGVTYKLLP